MRLPVVDNCCGCVMDLKAAAAIIAILGIVTSPAVSWAVIRHSYIIRMACFITSHELQPEVIDINLHNVLTFGFGVNAGLEPSCLLKKNHTEIYHTNKYHNSKFVTSVRSLGWLVLAADMIFVLVCIQFLYKIFTPVSDANQLKSAKIFMWTCIITITISFIYGMLHVAACIAVGGAFPVFEFVFSIVDIMLWAIWIYFILVIRSYVLQLKKQNLKPEPLDWYSYIIDLLNSTWTSVKNSLPEIPRYYPLSVNRMFLFVFSMDLLSNSGSFLQHKK